jgi:hypothetical protein
VFDVVRLISLLLKSFPDAGTIFFGNEPVEKDKGLEVSLKG